MRGAILLPFFLMLAACGVDGPPVPPGEGDGLTITGTASAGLAQATSGQTP